VRRSIAVDDDISQLGTRKLTRRRAPMRVMFADTLADYVYNLLTTTELMQLSDDAWRTIAGASIVNDLFPSEQRQQSRIRELVSRASGEGRSPRPARDPFTRNLCWLGSALSLAADEIAVLQFVLLLDATSELTFLGAVFGRIGTSDLITIVSAATTIPEASVRRALERTSQLMSTQLFSVTACTVRLEDKFTLKSGLLDALLDDELDRPRLVARYLEPIRSEALAWSDIVHIERAVQTARDLLRGALAARAHGVNLLLYGPTGTGKTAAASLLARELNVELYGVRVNATDDDEDENDKFSSLALGSVLLRDGASLLLLDELEDLFDWQWAGLLGDRPRGKANMTKLRFNQFLQTNPVPIILTTNQVSGIDDAFLRRFMYAIEFKSLGTRQRARILTRHLRSVGDIQITSDEIDRLAEQHELSPAHFATAVAAARLISPGAPPDRAQLEAILAPMQQLAHGGTIQLDSMPVDYTLDVINSPQDLRQLSDAVARMRPGATAPLSICLYGPPGTGKSAYIRHLAQRLDRRLLVRRPSDILGAYVGETEQRIASAFSDARDADAILLFDEVDSFLRDRERALRSWEITAVNEFLQQLEAHSGVVACTTNLWHDIDRAALRRFVIKAEFRYLRPEQALTMFERVLSPLLAAALTVEERARVAEVFADVRNLTPGDFVVVARHARALGGASGVEQLLHQVLEESRVKARELAPIGFAR
jgi:SpoVK/Ycf46/Vps4 family AAA+-type ATPase